VYLGAVKSLESEVENLLSFYQVQLLQWERKGRGPRASKSSGGFVAEDSTTNPIGRAFREVREGQDQWGSLLIEIVWKRILFAVFFHLNSKGQEVPSLLFTQNA